MKDSSYFLMLAVFLASFSIILTLGYFYIRNRLIYLLPVTDRSKKRIKIFVMIMIYSSFITMPFRVFENWFSDALLWYSFISLGIANFFLVLTFLRDIILFFDFVYRKVRIKLQENKIKTKEMIQAGALSRKEFFMNASNKAILAVSSGMTAYGIYEARKVADFVQVEVPIKRLPKEFDGFKITQITDIHIGPTIKQGYIQDIVQAVNYTKPELVAITGDLVDGSVEKMYPHAEPLKNLQSIHGTYFVTGNHEYYSGAPEWVKACRKLDMTVLLNEHIKITRNDAHLVIAGVTDYSAHRMLPEHKTDPAKAAATCEANSCKILLAHQPRSIFEAAKCGYDLQISGHTHGGQIFPWNFLVNLVQPFTRGLHLYENTWIYVNKGTGYWGPPMRLAAPSEIAEIILRSRG